jgi:anthranilate phosphoribosyltransferase
LATLLRGEELTTSDTEWAMGEVMAGEATPAQIASFVIALRAKGETAAEISGMASAMLAAAARVHSPLATDAVDIVGTGGDRAHTVNISTMAAITVAGTGVRVVKHGNRAASSLCGTADLLEHLGIPLDLGPDDVVRCVEQAGIAFCFAARFHPGMRHAGGPRREMGVPTAFNFLGPLTNPAQPRAGAIGCADERMAGIMADVFASRGFSTLVLRGEDGLDEFTTTAPTRVWVVADGEVRPTVIDAADLGVPRAKPADLRGGEVAVNADIARRFFGGERGPVRDAVLVNAAAGLVAHDGLTHSTDVAAALVAGIERAAQAIDSGSAAAALDRWIAVANSR